MVEAEAKGNRRQKAIALRYEEQDKAPKVIAAGVGEIARRIIELARENNIPIERNDTLAEILANLEVGYEIPPETYRAVAEILAFLYRTDEAWVKRVSRNKEFSLLSDKTAAAIDEADMSLNVENSPQILPDISEAPLKKA